MEQNHVALVYRRLGVGGTEGKPHPTFWYLPCSFLFLVPQAEWQEGAEPPATGMLTHEATLPLEANSASAPLSRLLMHLNEITVCQA